jgi:hypothetical protein
MTTQILDDMLRACALKYGKSWDMSHSEILISECEPFFPQET